jgi:hypothetical protein
MHKRLCHNYLFLDGQTVGPLHCLCVTTHQFVSSCTVFVINFFFLLTEGYLRDVTAEFEPEAVL